MSDLSKKIGRSVWFDLPVVNLADAMSFYEGLLGWQYSQMEESTLTDYAMIQVQDTLIGGLRRVPSLPKRSDVNGPILYFTVQKLAPKVARAKELGAELVGKIVDLGRDRGRYQWLRDREGNLIALWGPE
jgi:predicted enzyme related to lactoylglutathione lyase